MSVNLDRKMSYTELEHGYQGLRKARPSFYVGHETSSIIRSTTKVRMFLELLQ